MLRKLNIIVMGIKRNLVFDKMLTAFYSFQSFNVTDKSQFFNLYSTYKITNIYQQMKDLHMECPSTSTELSVCAVYRRTSCHFTGK